MEIKVIASTVEEQDIEKIKNILTDAQLSRTRIINDELVELAMCEMDMLSDIENKLSLAGKTAGICYMKDDYTSDTMQNRELAVKRARGTAKMGHHSIYDHGSITLLISGIPKIIAMLLNNTQYYTTSEKSARYTIMKPETHLESIMYNKWVEKFKGVIKELYTEIDNYTVEKLAQENARYLLSIFTPTVMAYTTSNRQLSYVVDWCDKMKEQLKEKGLVGNFYDRVCSELLLFKEELIEAIGGQVISDNKNRGFNLFAAENNESNEIFGDVYKLNYKATLAEIAQAQRHRTITHQISMNTESLEFYVPKCIVNTELEKEWIEDITKLSYCYPQGTIVNVTERGVFENFILKSKERMCGRAQLEICNISEHYMSKFIENRHQLSYENQKLLDRNTSNGKACTKCLMDEFKCKEVCHWGSKQGLTRLV